MRLLYSLFILLYNTILLIISPFHKKAGLMIKGRSNTIENIKQGFKPSDKVAWFHASSLGEFEQARPLIEEFNKKHPEYKILISFFSPSGYEVRKNYSLATKVVYLPGDSPKNARRFLEALNPDIVFFIKYEFWFNFIYHIHKRNIPLYQVSLILREKQYFFSWYGSWFREQLKKFDILFVQNQKTQDLLNRFGINSSIINGDTRFDRVNDISKNSKSFPIIEDFINSKPCLLCGSTWERDEEVIAKAIELSDKSIKIIIAPHEIDLGHINSIRERFPSSILFSNIENERIKDIIDKRILIIDSIGILSSLYKYSSLAYIGGGFGVGIHNILEAATFGKPICFGSNYSKFREAEDLISLKGAYSIKDENELSSWIVSMLEDSELYKSACLSSMNYVRDNIGASKVILDNIKLKGY